MDHTSKWALATLAAAFVGVMLQSCEARSAGVRTDANIISGVDVSSSISPEEIKIQLDGITLAMQSDEIQSRIQYGRFHQIGFAVYLWSDGDCAEVIEWRIISSTQDAADMSADLLARIESALPKAQGTGLTDISKAMLCGAAMLASAPFQADRSVLNIITNGDDNVGNDAAEARAALSGITVNAVAMPGGQEHRLLVPYLNNNVVTGPMSFVLPVYKAEQLIDAWRRKFIGDMS